MPFFLEHHLCLSSLVLIRPAAQGPMPTSKAIELKSTLRFFMGLARIDDIELS